jgi:trans-2,3-dihydro-3-hydroxyanthranilate isomerase
MVEQFAHCGSKESLIDRGRMSTPQLDYALVDVFAERALEGNQLAIFPDARGLSTGQMQALARETNLAETTFILPHDDPEHERLHGVHVRIFTVQEELPFAGHPTLGTASWLYWHHPTLRGTAEIALSLQAGAITVTFETPQSHEQGVFGTMRQLDPVFGAVHSREEVTRAIGMSVDDLDPVLPIETVSTGMPFCIVPLRSMEAIGRLAIPQAAAQAYLATTDAKFFYCTTRAAASSGADFHSRMQFYNGEDPATGSASGCAISYLVRHGVVPSGQATVLEQGIEIHRPSRLHVRASIHGDNVTQVFVGGRTIQVASGRFLAR